jgi:Uma2 family endonuclease
MGEIAPKQPFETDLGEPPLVIKLRPVIEMTDDQLLEFSSLNPDLRIELNADGELIIMPPTGGNAGQREAEITMQLRLWAKRDGTGTTFSPSTGFRLPNKAVRSPDAAWVSYERLAALSAKQRKKFIPLCPDFVIELRSSTDRLATVKDKMEEYLKTGAKLGWLIDPERKRAYVYKPGVPVEILEAPPTLSGDPVLPGFVLDLREIW